MTDTPEAQQDQRPTINNPIDLAKQVAALTLQEATNLGEINPAMQRRFLERMDQLFQALVSGAGVRWGVDGDLQIVWPTFENPILAAAKRRRQDREKELAASTAIPETALPNVGVDPDYTGPGAHG